MKNEEILLYFFAQNNIFFSVIIVAFGQQSKYFSYNLLIVMNVFQKLPNFVIYFHRSRMKT